MDQRYRNNNPPEQFNRCVNYVSGEQRRIAGTFMFVKYVTEATLQYIKSFPRRKTGNNLFVEEMKSAQVINAIDVVSVGMAEKYGIDAANLLAQSLRSQVGGRIDQNGMIVITNQQRCACPLVPWVIRPADRAAAANHGNSGGGATAQNSNLHTDQLS